ncbi:MAG TPA: response regulator transcription factor [Candidatus Kaiserbacteria bacterium]|nr:response regulator transcription factor [Candidatus Kaiserbacteria bacterium]
MKILVIDDKQEEREGAISQLSQHELTVVDGYSTGKEALQLKEWDVVLTDMLMPDYEGVLQPYGLVLSLMAQAKGIPVAVVSSGNHHDHRMLFAAEEVGGKVSENFFVLASRWCPTTTNKRKDWSKALDIVLGKARHDVERPDIAISG